MENVIQALAYLFRASRNTRPVLLLGAGASFRSGIPMAGKATERIARRAYSRHILGVDEEFGNPKPSDWLPFLQQQPWFVPDPKRFAENFPLAVENLLRPTEFRREFFTEMINPPNGINPGYHHLAKLMMRRLCWTVMTTNFDHNIVESLRELHSHIPEIVEVNRTADDLVRFSVYNNRCQVVYLHGAVEYYRDKNLVQEVERLDDQLVRRIRPIITDSPLIVIGYRGSEPSIMSHLLGEGVEESSAYRQGVYWCVLRGEEPHENVRELQARIGLNFQLIEIDGFDELMESLNRELEGEVWLPGTWEMAQTKPTPDLSRLDFDHRPMEGVALDELDHDLILSTLNAYCKQLRIPAANHQNYLMQMQEQGLLVGSKDGLTPTIGCYLLFGRRVSERFPYARVALTTKGKRRQVFDGNLIEQYRKLEARLTSDEVNPLLRIKGERTAEERPAYPPRTLTELIVNLLVHRDYEAEDYSHIEFEPGLHLRFTNPGGLMPRVYARVRIEDGGKFQPVRHASELRNKSLADIFFGLGPMDKDGSGLTDVHELMLENGGRAEFAVDAENRSVEVMLLQPRQSSPGRSCVAKPIFATELYITNLLPFSVIPQTIFVLPLREKPLKNLPLFEPDESPRELPIFITTSGKLLSFADLKLFSDFSERRGYLEQLQPEPVDEYIKDKDQRHHFVWLMGKHWEFFLKRFFVKGLYVERKRNRAFFRLLNGDKNTVIYDSRQRRGVRRDVVKRRGDDKFPWYENEGIDYAVVEFGGSWSVQIKPFYMFTGRDGCTPLPPFLRTQRATRRMRFDRNKNVDDDLTFWAHFLSNGQPTINLGGVGVSHLIIDSEYCSVEVPLLNLRERQS
jgi:SIR2-like domain